MPAIILRARPEDAAVLTSIAFSAKRHWKYPESWIRRWQIALTITSDYIVNQPTFVAKLNDAVVGFYALELDGENAILEHLWVVPTAMRNGIGRQLFEHAETHAKQAGARRLQLTSDPNAEGFYRRMGATTFGYKPAHIEGHARVLPLMEKRLA